MPRMSSMSAGERASANAGGPGTAGGGAQGGPRGGSGAASERRGGSVAPTTNRMGTIAEAVRAAPPAPAPTPAPPGTGGQGFQSGAVGNAFAEALRGLLTPIAQDPILNAALSAVPVTPQVGTPVMFGGAQPAQAPASIADAARAALGGGIGNGAVVGQNPLLSAATLAGRTVAPQPVSAPSVTPASPLQGGFNVPGVG